MPCYHPITAYRARSINDSGKRSLVFNKKDGFIDRPVEVPCGQCVGCRLERSRQWAVRCMCEAQLHPENSFITLTYSPEHLPEDWGLRKEDFQKFMKRLRKKLNGKKVRYYHCGEYGEKNLRPHYHAILFGVDFDDKTLFSSNNGNPIYTSDFLDSCWRRGFASIGNVTFESAAYVARYVMKKVTNNENIPGAQKKFLETYSRTDPETGEYYQVQPEYTTMSRRPGIGKDWYEKYNSDAYPSDYIVQRGLKVQPPRYFDNLYEIQDEEGLKKIKQGRRKRALKRKDDNTTERLLVRENVKLASIKQLKRPLDGD